MKTFKGPVTKETIPENGILVFGSNTQGRHGAGTALLAKTYFGAIYGQSKGLQGKSYSIVTKDLTKKTHPSICISSIIEQIEKLYKFARQNPDSDFYIPYMATGKNLNSYTPTDMANMFLRKNIPENIVFEESFYNLMLEIIDSTCY